MPRARSRLKLKKLADQPQKNFGRNPVPNSLLLANLKSLVANYCHHLVTLFFAFIFSFITYSILTKVSPDSIKHFILPNSYLPFLISFFLASFFLLSFLLLHTRRGFLLAIFLLITLFLKLQQVEITYLILLSLFLPLAVIEVIASLIK